MTKRERKARQRDNRKLRRFISSCRGISEEMSTKAERAKRSEERAEGGR